MLWLINADDTEWLRNYIGIGRLRVWLLTELGVHINVSKLAKEFGVTRNTINKWRDEQKPEVLK
jgi:hypothetical protein